MIALKKKKNPERKGCLCAEADPTGMTLNLHNLLVKLNRWGKESIKHCITQQFRIHPTT